MSFGCLGFSAEVCEIPCAFVDEVNDCFYDEFEGADESAYAQVFCKHEGEEYGDEGGE